MTWILALDFGGTKHTVGLVRQGERQWAARRQQTSPPGADAQTDLSIVYSLAHKALAEQGVTPDAVGVSFGGPVDFERGLVRLSHHVPGWAGVPLRERISAEFGAPAVMDNDANCGAWAEWNAWASESENEARQAASLLYVTVSTGIGGGWIIQGQVYRGAQSMAGEIGHTLVDPAGPVCICGRPGCAEILACGPAIARIARERLEAEPKAGGGLRRLTSGDLALVTADRVAQAAANGDALSQGVLLQAARALGTGLGNALSLMNPGRVVLGGGVTKSGEAWWAEVRRAARANTLPEIPAEIVPAALGDDAPLWGAALLAGL